MKEIDIVVEYMTDVLNFCTKWDIEVSELNLPSKVKGIYIYKLVIRESEIEAIALGEIFVIKASDT